MFNAESYKNWITTSWSDYLTRERITALESGNKEIAEEIENALKKSVVVGRDDILPGRVQFGSRVTVFGVEEEEEQSFQIVSEKEAQNNPGTISIFAPLAIAVMGAREGDVVEVKLANKANCSYEVTHIHLPLS